MTKQAPTLTDIPPPLPGESDAAYNKRLAAFLAGEDVRTKTDLRGFKTCDFSLDRSPMQEDSK